MLEAIYKCSSLDWKLSPVVALATSADESQVADAREDASFIIWLVSPGSVGCHCQLTIHGNLESRVSSLVWCRPGSGGVSCGGLFFSSIDGSVSDRDLFDLRQKEKPCLRFPALAHVATNAWMVMSALNALAETCETNSSSFNMPLLLFVSLVGATVGVAPDQCSSKKTSKI